MSAVSPLSPALLRKTAVVYIRQSTMAQVHENQESQRRQYGLVELARNYGFAEVVVIDDDLGRSGSGAVERPGFERLVGMLCGGSVGAVFCLEASRLARNGHDWHRLLELCGLVGARVIDVDGHYDPCRPNDRLLLGLKGTMSEFELNVLRGRLNEARVSKARRGELRIAVPIGYVWEPRVGVILDPDLRVQETIRRIFHKFRELGSARQVLLWLRREGLHAPRPADGKQTTAFEWRVPRYRTVISVLKNPFYAGVYAYGKSDVQTEVVDGRPHKRYGHTKPIQAWTVFLKEHHEGYLSWEEYQKNQQLLARNTFCQADGETKAARGGLALLAGLLRCRRCGATLRVAYNGRKGRSPRYLCQREQFAYGHPTCLRFGGWLAERAVVAEALRALQPLALEAAMTAEREADQRHHERRRAHELELEQARYDARLAERRYAACDPEHRLVAVQLEARWEEAIRRVRACEQQLATVDARPNGPPPIAELDRLAGDLAAAWHAPSTTPRTRQRLLRTLIEEIVVDFDDVTQQVILIIHWKGGQHSEVRVRKLKTGEHQRRSPDEAVEVVRQMAGRWPDNQIAATLNRMGFRTGQGQTWNARRVETCRKKRRIRAYKSAGQNPNWLTMSQAAQQLNVPHSVIRGWIQRGILPAEQVVPRAPYQIRAEDLLTPAVQAALVSRGRPCRKPLKDQDSLVAPK